MIKRETTKSTSFRASWKGFVRFGLVAFEVEAVNAQSKRNEEIHFHMLHKKDHERIHYAKVCPTHGEVTQDEIVQGYEISKGKYIEFGKEELDAFRTDKDREFAIDNFVAADEIDPIYFDGRMYYLTPSARGSREPYALLVAALEKKMLWGIGQIVFSGKEQLAVIRPYAGVLTMSMLNYAIEVRTPSEIQNEFSPADVNQRELKLALQLVEQRRHERFQLDQYYDHYQEKLREAIRAKSKGKQVETPKGEEPRDVINLMDALQKSLKQSSPSRRNNDADEDSAVDSKQSGVSAKSKAPTTKATATVKRSPRKLATSSTSSKASPKRATRKRA